MVCILPPFKKKFTMWKSIKRKTPLPPLLPCHFLNISEVLCSVHCTSVSHAEVQIQMSVFNRLTKATEWLLGSLLMWLSLSSSIVQFYQSYVKENATHVDELGHDGLSWNRRKGIRVCLVWLCLKALIKCTCNCRNLSYLKAHKKW